MISLIIPPKDMIARVNKMLGDEYGTASNIKSRVNRSVWEQRTAETVESGWGLALVFRVQGLELSLCLPWNARLAFKPAKVRVQLRGIQNTGETHL